MISKEKVIKLGNSLGFEIVRMCSADPFTDYEKTVKERIRTGFYPKELVSHEKTLENVETFADSSNSLPEAKRIISMAFYYYAGEPTDFTKRVSRMVFSPELIKEMFMARCTEDKRNSHASCAKKV